VSYLTSQCSNLMLKYFDLLTLAVFSLRNLPHCVSEANIGPICTRRVSRQQRSGHKPPPDHGRPEGRQAPLLPEPVTLASPLPVWLCRSVHLLFTSGLLQLSCCCRREALLGSKVCDTKTPPVLDIPFFFLFYFVCFYYYFCISFPLNSPFSEEPVYEN